uniref:Zinc finger and BTB domain-containing protein 44-like n=1 Tax=Hirondellea gigas TaxID=1518452 RepID=A0A2P2IBL5_9CRUS
MENGCGGESRGGGAGGQCYCLRWNNYQSSVVMVMRGLLHDRAFLDVTLACDGRSLQAHRLMLASCSDFFSTVLKENHSEHPIIFLRDVNFWELEAIMDFIYNGQVNIMQEQLPGFIRTAEALQIKGLAAVNNNNNNNNLINNNNNTENFNQKYNAHLQDLKFSVLNQDIKYENKRSPPLQHAIPPSYSPPPTPYFKRRCRESPQRGNDTEIPPRLHDSPVPEISPSKASSPLTINDTMHSLALNPNLPANSVASMASISVAKAISLSKLVHEISSQATIASLKSAALPPHHHQTTALPPDDFIAKEEPEPIEPNTPPPQQPLPQLPSAHMHNTKDWASSKNEDGFPACSLCGKVFKHQGSLVAHYQVHQQRTKCPVCQKVLSRHYHMKVHLLTVHKVPDSEIDSLLRTQCV